MEATIPDDWACVLFAAGDSLSVQFCLAVTVCANCNRERHFMKLTLCFLMLAKVEQDVLDSCLIPSNYPQDFQNTLGNVHCSVKCN